MQTLMVRDSCWSEFLRYMSSKELGDVIYRKELHAAINIGTNSGIDFYRTSASKRKFLKSAGRGKYEVTRKFPLYITYLEFATIPLDNLEYLEYILAKKEVQNETAR